MSNQRWWLPHNFSKKIPYLKQRSDVVRGIRVFFEKNDYVEVETPNLQKCPGMGVHMRAFDTEMWSVDLQNKQKMYLHTSPELTMKKLLVAGMAKIFQICKCYRNAEDSSHHTSEFTMLEWYHTGVDYKELMTEVIDLFRSVVDGEFYFRGMMSDPHQDWEIITVCDAFEQYAGIDIKPVLEKRKAFAELAQCIDIKVHKDDSWEDIFFRIFLEKIEPRLGVGTPTIIYDYPIAMADLARVKDEDDRFAERFEVYVCGLELANAYGELTDAVEQKKRFIHAMKEKQELYQYHWPVEGDFIAAIEHGLPEVSGIALGIDRFVMLAVGVDDIHQVQAAPIL